MFHADNCYWLPAVELRSLPLKTNTVSNTAFRGFGGPQGMVGGERVLEEIAFAVGLDPLEVRKRNFYGVGERNVTPYHQTVEDNVIHELVAQLERKAPTMPPGARRFRAFNAASPVLKRGLALTPVKFGISFTMTAYNQAGALVHVYTDGSVHLNHGGTEMGQGLHTKVAQVVAEEFQIDVDQGADHRHHHRQGPQHLGHRGLVRHRSERPGGTGGSPHDQGPADRLRRRALVGAHTTRVEFLPNRVRIGNQEIPFRALVWQAYMGRVSLSSTGFYKTPKIHWDRASGTGRPFYYFRLRRRLQRGHGRHADRRVPGRARRHPARLRQVLNPVLDIGQIEGGFVQGMGWLTTEELWWDKAGRLRTHAPSTYKIPACGDRPRIFNVALLEKVAEPRGRDLPLQGGGRAAADAGDLGPARDLRRRRQRRRPPLLPAARFPGYARAGAGRDRARCASVRHERDGWPCRLRELLAAGEPAVLVEVAEAKGSTPREAGCRDAGDRSAACFGTIGGGRLEWEAHSPVLAQLLARGQVDSRRGPSSCRWAPPSGSAAAAM